MSGALLLSPHLDDAILSCAGHIQHHVAQGQTVVVLTIFSHADPDDAAGWATRREEDRTAVARLGAQPRWLGLPDAPFRHPAYRDFDSLTGPILPSDASTKTRLAERLRHEVETLGPQLLYVPLGVGDHVDHRLVHEAAAGLPVPRVDYEDRPYALVDYAIRRRLDALGLHHPAVDAPAAVDDYLDALADAPYIEAYLPPGPARERACTRLARWPSPRPTRPVACAVLDIPDPLARRAEDAIWDYRSQTPALYGARRRYRALTRAHAQHLGSSAPHAERVWRGVDPTG